MKLEHLTQQDVAFALVFIAAIALLVLYIQTRLRPEWGKGTRCLITHHDDDGSHAHMAEHCTVWDMLDGIGLLAYTGQWTPEDRELWSRRLLDTSNWNYDHTGKAKSFIWKDTYATTTIYILRHESK